MGQRPMEEEPMEEAPEKRTTKSKHQRSVTEIQDLEREFRKLEKAIAKAKEATETRNEIYSRGVMYAEYTIHEVEIVIARHAIADMKVNDVLQWSSVLVAVKHVLETDDALWHSWWTRDFPDFARKVGPDLPKWVSHTFYIDMGETLSTPKVVEDARYARVPWRRYYSWCTFYRIRALKEIGRIMDIETKRWIEKRMWQSTRTSKNMPINMKWSSLEGFEVHSFRPRKWNYSTPANIQLLYDENGKGIKPEAMVDGTAKPTYNEKKLATWGEQLLEEGPSAMEVYEQVDRTYGMLLDAGYADITTTDIGHYPHAEVRGDVNFSYSTTMDALRKWFKLDPADMSHATLSYLSHLPPAPMVNDTVFFVGESIVSPPQITCVGCGLEGKTPMRCAVCKSGYCGAECHRVTWTKNCSDCKQ